jgi:hypothetical protein
MNGEGRRGKERGKREGEGKEGCEAEGVEGMTVTETRGGHTQHRPHLLLFFS